MISEKLEQQGALLPTEIRAPQQGMKRPWSPPVLTRETTSNTEAHKITTGGEILSAGPAS
jgi:hypothetical protein